MFGVPSSSRSRCAPPAPVPRIVPASIDVPVPESGTWTGTRVGCSGIEEETLTFDFDAAVFVLSFTFASASASLTVEDLSTCASAARRTAPASAIRHAI